MEDQEHKTPEEEEKDVEAHSNKDQHKNAFDEGDGDDVEGHMHKNVHKNVHKN